MFTLEVSNVPCDLDGEYDTANDVVAALRKLKPDVFVSVEAPAGRYTGLDTIPYYGPADEVIYDLRQRYRLR